MKTLLALVLIRLMDDVAKQTKVGIIDIHGAFKGKGELIPDKIQWGTGWTCRCPMSAIKNSRL